MASKCKIWLRAEVKPFEHRTPITPADCAKLLQAGYDLIVERFSERCIKDEDYAKVGCTLVERGSWTTAPKDAFILGLKELPESNPTALVHRHIYFAHCFKYQTGWVELLQRFNRGGGRVLDLEFLSDANGRRVAAFGYMAGYTGSALGLKLWAQKMTSPTEPFGPVNPYPNKHVLIEEVREALDKAKQASGRTPSVLVIGALGRCGNGAVDFVKQTGLAEENIIQWDLAETKKGGPFPELLDVDVLVNCIYLSQKFPPFITRTMLEEKADRRLSVVVDVSCDYTSPNNPLPFYSEGTTFAKPAVTVALGATPSVDVISIDHLPTLLPLESSQQFGADLLPSLLQLDHCSTTPVWQKADALYDEKLSEALKK